MKNLPQNIKAEAFINYLKESDCIGLEYSVFYEGAFKRNYSNDILKIENICVAGRLIKQNFHLSREGFYDKLPEGFFHLADRFLQLPSKKKDKSFDEAYDKQLKEKEYARKFFFPFENSLFALNLKLEEIIYKWHKDPLVILQSTLCNDDLFSDIDAEHKQRMLRFLHFFYRFRYDKQMLSFFLGIILGAQVEINQTEKLEIIKAESHSKQNTLGEATLNVDFVCGDRGKDLVIDWNICLTPASDELSLYLENKNIKNICKMVERYFVPAGVRVFYKLIVHNYAELRLFDVGSTYTNQFLGYNIII